MLPLLTHLSATATGALVSAVWEGALLAAVVMVCLRLFPAMSAAARSIIWLNVFILLALLHVLPFVAMPSARHAAAQALPLDLRWSLLVAALWLALSLGRAVQLAVSAAHVRGLVRRATPVPAAPELEPLLRAGRRSVQLCASDEVARPSVLGFLKPRILVPPALLENLSPAELRQVVLHEMEHLRRGDDWTNLLQKIALVLFPLNPALLWVERRLCTERELACDDRVLHSGSGRKAYALCLTHLAEYSLMQRGFSLMLGAWERRPELVRRVQRILAQPARTMGRRPALAASGAMITGALGCTLMLAHAPQLVRFVPGASMQQAQSAPSFDIEDYRRAFGGTPQMVKAVVSREPQPQARPVTVRKRHKNPAQPAARLASLRTPPPPAVRTLLVMTKWTELPTQTQLVLAQWPDAAAGRQIVGRPAAIPAMYIVRTPTGWFILQI